MTDRSPIAGNVAVLGTARGVRRLRLILVGRNLRAGLTPDEVLLLEALSALLLRFEIGLAAPDDLALADALAESIIAAEYQTALDAAPTRRRVDVRYLVPDLLP